MHDRSQKMGPKGSFFHCMAKMVKFLLECGGLIFRENPLKLFVKNITVSAAYLEIRQIFERLACHLNYIDGSEFDIAESLSQEQGGKLKALMEDKGFEVVTDRQTILTEKIKKLIIEMVHFSEEPP